MYRLVLLDDEEIVTKGIQKVFDLESFGFFVVGTFQNPKKALEQISVLQPDLIITDVKMPQMDGLEFSGKARQILPDVEIVILSGYDDFSYAQTAVKIGVSDYLLKPIKKDDFKHMLERVHQKIDEKRSKADYYNSLQEFAESNYEEMKNRFFLECAENGVLDQNRYQALEMKTGRSFLDSIFLLIRMDIFRMSTVGDYMSELGKVTGEIEAEISGYGCLEEFLSDESLYFYLYDIDPNQGDEIREVVRAFGDAKRQSGTQFTIAVSQVHEGLTKLFAARNDCIRQILMEEIHIDENSDANPVRMQDTNLVVPYMELENLFRSISTGDSDKMREAVEKIYEVPAQASTILYRDYSYSITYLILIRMVQLQNKYNAQQPIVPQELLDYKNLRKEYPTVERQKELVGNSAFLLSDLIAKQKVAAPSKMILTALQYINEHFSENISLTDVAENINISKNYLCDIFKKELGGVTFINYVTNLRIEKAKEYLANTDMKMYEVSSAVGYNDYAYFSQLFKKHTGMTLSAYRRQA